MVAAYVAEYVAAKIAKKPTWLLWDGPPAHRNKAQFNGSCPVFVMSSPNDKNYHEFIKGRWVLFTHSHGDVKQSCLSRW